MVFRTILLALFLAISAGGARAQAIQAGQTMRVLDPCQTQTHTYNVVNINTAVNTKIVTGTASKKTYVCFVSLYSNTAENLAIVEGTGTNCATGTAGMYGGATSGTGINFITNQGTNMGDGTSAVMVTATAADDFCFITNTTQLSGIVVTVQQ